MNIKLPKIKDAIPGIVVDMKYATTDNFTGKIVYSHQEEAVLQQEGINKLRIAQSFLQNMKPELSLVVWDAARPEYAQYYLWEQVKDTPNSIYIANPEEGSLHTYGMAVDITICDRDMINLDMGTAFDHFGEMSHPEYEELLIQDGKLTHYQLANRLLLRYVMVQAGFTPIPHEWWHFNVSSLEVAKAKYKKIIDFST
jgi:D-alanyl-D-alanine dipeptidase